MSQEKLGAALADPTSKGTISQYETGDRSPSLLRLYQIAEALGCTPGEILDGPRETPALPSAEQLARMIQRTMEEMPVGVSYADYPQAVAAGLLARLERFQVSGGLREPEEQESARDTGSLSPAPTTPDVQEGPRTR